MMSEIPNDNHKSYSTRKLQVTPSGVTRVGDTRGATTEGVTPLFFPEKPGDLFLVAGSAVSPLISSSQKLTTFFAHRFIAFYCFHSGVTPLEAITLHLFYLSDLVSPLFFVNLPTKIFFLRVSPPWRVSPGAVRPLAPP